jgi:hypothetical protein
MDCVVRMADCIRCHTSLGYRGDCGFRTTVARDKAIGNGKIDGKSGQERRRRDVKERGSSIAQQICGASSERGKAAQKNLRGLRDIRPTSAIFIDRSLLCIRTFPRSLKHHGDPEKARKGPFRYVHFSNLPILIGL